MKKEYVKPLTDALQIDVRYGVLEDENSGIAGGGSSLGKSTNFEAEDGESKPFKSVNLWSDDDNNEED